VADLPRVTRFLSRSGIRVYRLSVETFPSHINQIYLILDGALSTLLDVGSGTDQSIEDLTRCVETVRDEFGESIRLEQIQHVVISHSHIDHFGYVPFFRARTDAIIYVHELDAGVLNNFEERLQLTGTNLRVFLERTGLPSGPRRELEEMYRLSKHFYKSIEIDRTLNEGDRIINGYVVHHVPGHCPGQICLEVDNLLFTADHVLSRITPHQSPGSITPFCGLDLYLHSLQKIRGVSGISLVLPGHEAEILDLQNRIDEIRRHHEKRLDQVLQICGEPKNLVEISKSLFGSRGGYTRLLALLEAGAHVEYLFQHAALGISHQDAKDQGDQPVVYYQTHLDGTS